MHRSGDGMGWLVLAFLYAMIDISLVSLRPDWAMQHLVA